MTDLKDLLLKGLQDITAAQQIVIDNAVRFQQAYNHLIEELKVLVDGTPVVKSIGSITAQVYGRQIQLTPITFSTTNGSVFVLNPQIGLGGANPIGSKFFVIVGATRLPPDLGSQIFFDPKANTWIKATNVQRLPSGASEMAGGIVTVEDFKRGLVHSLTGLS